MAYADQQGMSTGRIISIILVLLLHVALGYALVTGLAYEAITQVKERLEVLDIEEEKPPEEEPPPPPPEEVIVAQPPVVAIKTPAPTRNQTTTTKQDTDKVDIDKGPVMKTCPPNSVSPMVPEGTACVAKQQEDPMVPCPSGTRAPNGATQVKQSQIGTCKAPEVDKSAPASPSNNRGSWVTTNDYPTRSLQREEEGTTSIRLTVGANGRATGCTVTGSSGSSALDDAACKNAQRRAKFTPAKDKSGNPTTGSYDTRIRWQIPK